MDFVASLSLSTIIIFLATCVKKRGSRRMDSCNPSKCARLWPSNTERNHHHHASRNASNNASSSVDIVEGINSRLNTMSMAERSQGINDLHGVADTPNETVEKLNTKVGEMNTALSSFGYNADSLPYQTALEMDAEYVESLKIPFIRKAGFNSREAASLMLRFFGYKLDLFGEEKLVQDILLSDLDRPGEMEACREKGLGQLLPHRDRSGRVVILNVGRVNQQYDIQVVLRVTFYFMMMVFFQEVDESQKKGVVCIYFGFGQTKVPLSRVIAYNKLLRSLPVRIAASHVCRHDDSNGNLFKVAEKYLTEMILDLNLLCRWRSHVGTQTEVMYRLMTFGLIKGALPLTKNGELDLTNHHRMLDHVQKREVEEEEARDLVDNVATTSLNFELQEEDRDDGWSDRHEDSSKEETRSFLGNIKATGVDVDLQDEDDNGSGGKDGNKNKNGNLILVPGHMDILMGRGRQPTSRSGAFRLRQVVVSYREQYDAGTKFEKQVITEVILKQVKEFGCRFLKETNGGYEECDDAVAKSKISAGFRNARIRTRIQQQQIDEGQNGRGPHISQKRRLDG